MKIGNNSNMLFKSSAVVVLVMFVNLKFNGLIVVSGRVHRRDEILDWSSSTQHVDDSTYTQTNKHFSFSDCADSPVVQVLNISASPVPIRTPGRVTVSAQLNVTQQLPSHLAADVLVSKQFFGVPLKLPCIRNFGTCHYSDVCGLLEELFPTDRQCPRVLRKHNIPCRCPFNAGLLQLSRYSFRLPSFKGLMQSLATGEYDVRVRLYNNNSLQELGCLQVQFNMKKKKPVTVRRQRKQQQQQQQQVAPPSE